MKLCAIIIGLIVSTCSYAQTLVAESDATLNKEQIYASTHPRKDKDGISCAVLMIHSTVDGLAFRGNVVGNVECANSTYYVYLSAGTKWVDVCKGNEKLRLKFPAVVSKATYEVKVFSETLKGYLNIASNPAGSFVSLISGNDTIPLGKTPIKGNVEISPGVYIILIEKQGYAPRLIGNVRIRSQKTKNLGTIKL